MFGRFYEDLHAGETFHHWPGKTITESDNNLFCLLTRNAHPLHSDFEYAKATHFGRPVVVGTLVISLVVGMSVPDISGAAIANLEYRSIEHTHAVFIGDTIHAQSTIVRKRPSKKTRGVVTVKTRAYNQDDLLVLTMERTILVPKKGHGHDTA